MADSSDRSEPPPSRDSGTTPGEAAGSPSRAREDAPEDGGSARRRPEEDPPLPPEVEKLLVAFARALQKHAMYPAGHPALDPAARSVEAALRRATEDRKAVSLSVAPDRVGVEEAATDPETDLFRSLARRLYRHHLSVVTLEAGAGEEEIGTLLEALALEPDEENAAGLRFDGLLPGCPHVQVQPVPYAAMRLATDSDETQERARSVWLELARVAQELGRDAEEEDVPLDPEVVARAVGEASGDDPEYAGEVLERLSEAARLFRGTRKREGGGGALGTLSEQMSTLVRELPPEIFVRLLENGGTPEQARQILFDVSFQLEPEAMERILDAVADVRFVEISGWLHRIFGKLGAHARSTEGAARDEADEHMREQIREMVSRWELENPNPTEYEEALSDLAFRERESGTSHLGDAGALRMVRMGLEVDAGGEWMASAAAEVREDEERTALVRDLVETPGEVEAAGDAWRGVVRPEWMRGFFGPPAPEQELIEGLLAHCGPDHAGVLLDALADSESRSVRRAIFDRLSEMGDAVGPEVADRLSDDRWYIRRNLLALLNEMGELPPGFSPGAFLDEEHPEVRHEAITLGLRDPETRAHAMEMALDDPHSRTVITGLAAAREGCPSRVLPRVAEAALDEDLSWTVRVHAIRALGAADHAGARDALLELVTRRRWPLFWKRTIREPSDAVLEGLRVLREGWGDDARARRVLRRAREVGDERIRAAARGETPAGSPR